LHIHLIHGQLWDSTSDLFDELLTPSSDFELLITAENHRFGYTLKPMISFWKLYFCRIRLKVMILARKFWFLSISENASSLRISVISLF